MELPEGQSSVPICEEEFGVLRQVSVQKRDGGIPKPDNLRGFLWITNHVEPLFSNRLSLP